MKNRPERPERPDRPIPPLPSHPIEVAVNVNVADFHLHIHMHQDDDNTIIERLRNLGVKIGQDTADLKTAVEDAQQEGT